jgi:hypothetical protein
MENMDIHSEGMGGFLRRAQFEIGVGIVPIHEVSHADSLRYKLMQELKALRDRGWTEYCDARGVAAWSVEARYQALP